MIMRRGWMSWGLVALVACSPGDGGDETGGESGDEMTTAAVSTVTENASDPTGTPTSDPSGTPLVCDPAGCSDYCEWARCLWDDDIDGAKCRAACEENCGDDSFDDSDRDLMACQAKVTSDFNCADSVACCESQIVNQICPD